jgi:16S rRNA (cytosine967-C5)-methyltransferase
VTPRELHGRAAAILAVADVLAGRGFVHDALAVRRRTGRLAGREAALATELGFGTVRHLVTIEHVLGALASFDRSRTPAPLRAILYTAVYQIIWMDRIPLFAVVDQAVALARRLVRGGAPGMVNAVLRRVTAALEERRVTWRRLAPTQVRISWDQACQFRAAVLPESNDAAHLAAATGERPERYAALVARYGAERAEAVTWASQATPVMVLHRNPLRIGHEEFELALRNAFGPGVEFAAEAAFLPASAAVIETQAFRDGLAYVQDCTAHAAARAVGARPGERILDLCAAPGGKSLALALDMEDRGEVLACDAAPERLALVRENVERLKLTCLHLCPLVEGQPGLDRESFDAALVDVPCSNTGVIARRPEARLGLTAVKLQSLIHLQRQLLRQAAEYVRPGGRLVYSTCSLEPEENEELVADFLRDNPAWRLDHTHSTLPAWGPCLSGWRDGGYFACLVRV